MDNQSEVQEEFRGSVGKPLIVRIPLKTELAAKAFHALKSVKGSQEFVISTATVDHSDIGSYVQILLEQFADSNKDTIGK
jgi:hypothetical protein